MSRLVRKPITVFSFSFAFLLAPIWLWLRPSPATPIVPLPPLAVLVAPATASLMLDGEGPARPPHFKVLLIRAGLSPEALAAAGVSSESVSTIVGDALTAMGQNPSALATLDTSFADARHESDARRRKIQWGHGGSEDVTIYQSSTAAMNSAATQRETLLSDVQATATSGLTQTQKTALTNLRANAHWNLAKEFMVVNHTEAEWVALRDALANERIAARLGDEPDAGCQALLATYRANSAVITATTGLGTQNLAAVRSAWNTAAGND